MPTDGSLLSRSFAGNCGPAFRTWRQEFRQKYVTRGILCSADGIPRNESTSVLEKTGNKARDQGLGFGSWVGSLVRSHHDEHLEPYALNRRPQAIISIAAALCCAS